MNIKLVKILSLAALLIFGYLNQKELGLKFPDLSMGGGASISDSISQFKIDKQLDARVKNLPENLKELVGGLNSIVNNASNNRDHKKDLFYLGNYYRDYARVVAADKEKIKTTGQIREANVLAGKLMFESLEIQGQYSGLGEKIDSVMKESFGLDNRNLDTEVNGKVLRDQVVDTFLAIAEEFYKGI